MTTKDKRWFTLYVLCLGSLMFVLDTTIVNVALPSIKKELGFSANSLAWVINAYMLTFGGFLLLGGRLGDLYGNRKLFLLGIVVFTLASLVCGVSQTQTILIVARTIQGFGGAIFSAVSLSIIMNLFYEPSERAKAMGVFGFVAAGGGSLGVLLGGFLTSALNWHWIFLVNLPVGIAVFLSCLKLLPASKKKPGRLDVWGAITVTLSLLIAVYAIVNGNETGWTSSQTVFKLLASVLLFVIFLQIERRVKSPIMPLSFFKLRNLSTASVMGILWAAAMFAWFFLSALYLQILLHYTPLQVGLAFLPGNLIMAVFSISLSAKIVMKFGIKKAVSTGLFLAAVGLGLLSRAPLNGVYWIDIFPSMVFLGIGAGMAFNPLLLAAMSEVKSQESGLASGIVNTAFMMGGALGLAVLASLAASRTGILIAQGMEQNRALLHGYHASFMFGAIFALIASILGSTMLQIKNQPQH